VTRPNSIISLKKKHFCDTQKNGGKISVELKCNADDKNKTKKDVVLLVDERW